MKENNYYIFNLFYANKNDKRLFVPKKWGMGWTINFSHPKATFCLFLLMVIILFFLFAFILLKNHSFLKENLNIFYLYGLSIFASIIVFSFTLLKFKLNLVDINIILSYGILSCLLGFGVQQIFNGIPFLLIKNIKWYYHIYFAAIAAISQSFGKFSLIYLLQKLNDDKNKILKYGLLIGFGFTITEISLITLTLIIKKIPIIFDFLSIFERASVSIFHIYSSGLIAIGLIKQTYKFLISIITIHWLLDLLAGIYRFFNISIYLLEIFIFLIGLFIFITYFYQIKNFHSNEHLT